MKRLLISLAIVISLFGGGVFGQTYNLVDLGRSAIFAAVAINKNGWIVGNSGNTAMLYVVGVFQSLPTTISVFPHALGINDSGQVVGDTSGTANNAFLYSGGVMFNLGSLGINYSSASSINNAGEITGMSYNINNQRRVFLYSSGSMYDIGSGVGRAINSSGQIVGQTDNEQAFLFSNNQMTGLGTISGPHSIAVDINDNSQVIGWSDVEYGARTHATLWQNGSAQDLGTLGGRYSYANAINSGGLIVGTAEGANWSGRAFLYKDGGMVELNSLVDLPRGSSLTDALDINDSGQILCSGIDWLGDSHTYLLTQIPEPSFLLPLGLVALTFWRRR